MTAHERARIVAERVADRIHAVAPEGLGHWPPVWDHIGAPSDTFMDRLAEWATKDTPTTRSKLESSATALVEAWREASRQWTRAGRPCLVETTEAVPGAAMAPTSLAASESTHRGAPSAPGADLTPTLKGIER